MSVKLLVSRRMQISIGEIKFQKLSYCTLNFAIILHQECPENTAFLIEVGTKLYSLQMHRLCCLNEVDAKRYMPNFFYMYFSSCEWDVYFSFQILHHELWRLSTWSRPWSSLQVRSFPFFFPPSFPSIRVENRLWVLKLATCNDDQAWVYQ